MNENGIKVVNPESGQDDTSGAEQDKWGIEQEVCAGFWTAWLGAHERRSSSAILLQLHPGKSRRVRAAVPLAELSLPVVFQLSPLCRLCSVAFQEKEGYFKMMQKHIGADVTSLVTLPVIIFEPHGDAAEDVRGELLPILVDAQGIHCHMDAVVG